MDTLPAPITSKAKMYELLAGGALGNTIPVYFSLRDWLSHAGDTQAYPLWGIRSASRAGDARMRLNVPRGQVMAVYREWYPNGGGCISPMIDQYAVIRGEVFENAFGHPFGMNLFYVPEGVAIDQADPWRGSFRAHGKTCAGLTALTILKHYLWPGSYEDLRALLDRYPGHVVEFSACDRAVGLIPGRNTVIWECRLY